MTECNLILVMKPMQPAESLMGLEPEFFFFSFFLFASSHSDFYCTISERIHLKALKSGCVCLCVFVCSGDKSREGKKSIKKDRISASC